ncbi:MULTISPECIES: hypothetical protein [Leeuwenhoekiella]|uniref:hypothetical protein n=2 Tax=Flavobacteriaceae TaxID=49546 RepID=UPI0002F48C88|nr:hypothetical protein [Leeuwenhoekiella blandensis]
MLILKNPDRLKFIDVEWRPERDLSGSFHLTVLNYLEDYDNRLNTFEVNPDWDNPILEISIHSRLALVNQLEELMRILPPYEDPRMTLQRGVVDDTSESYRLELITNGISTELVGKIIENGSAQIQNHCLDHPEITRDLIKQFAENGITKKVKNKANTKLKSKRWR